MQANKYILQIARKGNLAGNIAASDGGPEGLRISDRVLAINCQSVTHIATSDSLYDLLAGPLGSSVDIVVDRVTCAPQPLTLSVPRSSIEEHLGGKVFSDGEVIWQGWISIISKDGRQGWISIISKDGRCKRRWAQLKFKLPFCFEFSWGEIGPAGFVENGSASSTYPPTDSICIEPLDHPPHGQQLSAPCCVYGFKLQIGSRSISFFCNSKFDRTFGWSCRTWPNEQSGISRLAPSSPHVTVTVC
jgi:hypothetical protein